MNSTPIATLTPTETYRVYSDHLNTSRRVVTDDEEATIKSVIDEVKEDNPAESIVMVGHSFGGDTATEFVEQYPNFIDMLVTVDPVGWFRTMMEYSPIETYIDWYKGADRSTNIGHYGTGSW